MTNRKPTCGLALHRPKTAALFFDLIYGPSEPDMPPNIIPYPLKGGEDGSKIRMTQTPGDPKSGSLWVDMSFAKVQEDIELRMPELLEHLSGFGLHPIPVFDSEVDLRESFQKGTEAVITAAISNVGIIDESRLEWAQVAEIRLDDESGAALRRFRHWFDTGLAQREQSFVENEIMMRVEAYDAALKKHGVLTALGESLSLINSRSFGVSVVSGLAFPEHWMIPAGITIGSVILKVCKAAVERRYIKHDHAEIAYVHELRRRFSANRS